MTLPKNLEVARKAKLAPLEDIAASIGIGKHLLEPYGEGVAKVKLEAIEELRDRPRAKYVVVSAITPTPLGEGKTTTTVGLGQAFKHIGKTATVAVRQASMGPVFGIKGGAAGGGYSQVVPMEMLNLHLTGDIHAVTAAHNLLAAMMDNHIHHHDDFFHVDRHTVTLATGDGRKRPGFKEHHHRPRRAGRRGHPRDGLRHHGGLRGDGDPRALDLAQDLRERLGRIVIGNDTDGNPITAEDLKAAGAMAVIMKEAIKPNLMQTLENTPALVHAGPFGNIATGNSSIVADLIGIRGGDLPHNRGGLRRGHGGRAVLQHQVPQLGLEARRGGARGDGAGAQGPLGPLRGEGRTAAARGDAPWRTRRRHALAPPTSEADREHPSARRLAGGGDQRLPHRPRLGARRHQGGGRGDGRPRRRSATTSRRAARGPWNWPRRSPKPPRSRPSSGSSTPKRRL